MRIRNLKSVFIAAFATITLYSCNNDNNKMEQTQLPDGHTAQNALDWEGTYSGSLPCADCDQIETELTLTGDSTYILTSHYIGKAKPISDTLNGKFTWEGNNVKLEGISQNERSSMFKVEENQIRYLDMEGKVITGDLSQNYVMRKEGNLSVEDKRWQLVELNGKPVKGTAETHYIIFHSKEGRLEAKVDCNMLLNEYKIKNEFQVKIVPGISTMMACPDSLEQEFSEILFKADNLSISADGKTLSLNKARMAPLARFEWVAE